MKRLRPGSSWSFMSVPNPNLAPATFTRMADNVKAALANRSWAGLGLRAVSQAVRRPWLAKLLPQRSALLRPARRANHA